MYTNRLTAEECERLYYSAGLPEIAALYARIEDTPVLVELQDDLTSSQAENRLLRDKLNDAEVVVFDLYERLMKGDRFTHQQFLEELDKIKLEIK